MSHEPEKDKLDEIYRLVKSDHEIIVSMDRRDRISFYGKILYWAVVFGVLGGAFYFVQPYLAMLGVKQRETQAFVQDIQTLKNSLPSPQTLDAINQALPKNGIPVITPEAVVGQAVSQLTSADFLGRVFDFLLYQGKSATSTR